MTVVLSRLQGQRGGRFPALGRYNGGREEDQAGNRQQQREAANAEHQRRFPVAEDAAAAPRGRETQQGQSHFLPAFHSSTQAIMFARLLSRSRSHVTHSLLIPRELSSVACARNARK